MSLSFSLLRRGDVRMRAPSYESISGTATRRETARAEIHRDNAVFTPTLVDLSLLVLANIVLKGKTFNKIGVLTV